MLDILVYLFENYIYEEAEEGSSPAQLRDELVRAGFSENDIERAFSWLEGLSGLQGESAKSAAAVVGQTGREISFRIYSVAEQAVIGRDEQGLLLYLEQIGVLNAEAREAVIDRVMALETTAFDKEHLKWVVLMVLFNQPGAESSYAWMEDFVYDGAPDLLN